MSGVLAWRVTLRDDATVDGVELVVARPLDLEPARGRDAWLVPVPVEVVELDLPSSSSDSGALTLTILLERGTLELVQAEDS